jgi:haloacetate dehalogenase
LTHVDFFPGFARRDIALGEVSLHVRIGGAGAPLVLLHGYPQSHLMWRHVAPALAARFTVVLPDLRGYGCSSIPGSRNGEGFSKRVMAADIVALMRELGHERFCLAGHDRGARVGYRLALDHPQRVEKLAVLDIVPTEEMWRGMDAARALSVYHWMFLAQPEPLPETLIARSAREYVDHTLASWTATRSLDCFGIALESYRAAFADPARIHATCEDYRAGATIDRAADEADLASGNKIAAPLLALWGAHGIPASGANPVDVWRRWATDVRGHGIEGGHFLPEEAPETTQQALLDFFT